MQKSAYPGRAAKPGTYSWRMNTAKLLALTSSEWESYGMSDTNRIIVGDKGRVVIPASVREELDWAPGTELRILRTENGVELLTTQALLNRMRGMFSSDTSVVDELIAERRAESRREDQGIS